MVALVAVMLAGPACGRSGPAEATPTPTSTTASPAAQVVPSPTPEPTATPTPSPTPTPVPLDAKEVLERAGRVMSELSSFHFRLKHQKGSTEFAPGLYVEEAEGDVVNPDSIQVAFTGTFGKGFAIRSELITIGTTSYMKNPLSGKWEAVPVEISPLGFFSPARGIAAMTGKVTQERLLSAGMFARVTLTGGPSEPIVAVPKDAIVERAGIVYVATVTPGPSGGSVGMLWSVTVGADVGDWIAVTSGNVAVGTPVITRGNEGIMPFPTPVQIVDDIGSPVAMPAPTASGRGESVARPSPREKEGA